MLESSFVPREYIHSFNRKFEINLLHGREQYTREPLSVYLYVYVYARPNLST